MIQIFKKQSFVVSPISHIFMHFNVYINISLKYSTHSLSDTILGGQNCVNKGECDALGDFVKIR